jgi:thioredoxin reductase (NADPH)
MSDVDLAIVGAGPTGLYAAYYAGFRGLSTVVIDALPEPGGQVTAMYPEKAIFDVAGFPTIKGRELVANLVEQAAQFDPTYLLGIRAEKLAYDEEGKPNLTLSDGSSLRCGAVVITGGLGSFTSRPLPAAEAFTGDGVLFFVKHLHELTGQDVVIVGGGDSAFDWALALQPLAKSVTLVHRRDKFRAHAATVARVQSLPVNIIVNAEVTRILGDGRVSGCEVQAKGQRRGRCRRTPSSRRWGSLRTLGRWPSGGSPSTGGTSWSTPRPPPICLGSTRPGTSRSTPARFG